MRNDARRSKALILTDLKRIQTDDSNIEYSVGLIDDNAYRWEIIIFGPQKSPYASGIYIAEMTFPLNYPEAPPKFRFITPMWHPNIDKEGNVCISILHNPGNDEYEYEELNERWLPVRTPESIIMSIISLLNSPNCESPANFDASVQYRENIDGYVKKVQKMAQESTDYSPDIPE